nr:hypothetical protein [Tanacetum cinerariifolium]
MHIKNIFRQATSAEYSDVKESIEESKENDNDKKCLLISNETVKGGNGSKEGNRWFENQMAETSDKSKTDRGYVMRRNKSLLGVAWKPLVKMRTNGSIMSGNYRVSCITRESEVTDESKISDNTPGGRVSLYQPSDDLCELLTSSLGVIVGKGVEAENGSSRASLMAVKTMFENVVGSVKRNQLEDLLVVRLEVIKNAQSHTKMSSQTQSSVGVHEEAWESLRDTLVSFLRDEMKHLRDEMRREIQATSSEYSDVKESIEDSKENDNDKKCLLISNETVTGGYVMVKMRMNGSIMSGNYRVRTEIELAIHTDSRHADRLRAVYASKEAAEIGYVEIKRIEFLGSRKSFEMLNRVPGENNSNVYELLTRA